MHGTARGEPDVEQRGLRDGDRLGRGDQPDDVRQDEHQGTL